MEQKKSFKRFKVPIIITIVVVLSVVGVLIGLSIIRNIDTKSYSFDLISEPKAQDLAQKGWIPQAVPDDATDIELKYDIDTNEIWLKFETETNLDKNSLTIESADSKKESIESTKISREYVDLNECSSRWWPDYLSSEESFKTEANISVFEYNYKDIERREFFVVKKVEKDQYEVFYWALNNDDDISYFQNDMKVIEIEGVSFDVPSTYQIKEDYDLCFEGDGCVYSMSIASDDSDFSPRAYFSIIEGEENFKVKGQTTATIYDSDRKIWEMHSYRGAGDDFEEVIEEIDVWGATDDGYEIVRAGTAGSHGGASHYLIIDPERELLYKFSFRSSIRIRCDMKEDPDRQNECYDWLESVGGQAEGWLFSDSDYFESKVTEQEEIVKSFVVKLTKGVDTTNWNTYHDEAYGIKFNFEYPENFSLTSTAIVEDYAYIIESPKKSCKPKGSTDGYEDISEQLIRMTFYHGGSFSDTWYSSFGFSFKPGNYDGAISIDGYNAYYFVRGAEDAFGHKFYLVDLGNGKSLKVDSRIPSYDFECENGDSFSTIEENNTLAEEIISTFTFVQE